MDGGGGGGGGVPKGWLGCPRLGVGLIAQTFLPFKTPLKPSLNRNLDKDKQFGLEDVYKELERLKKQHVLWIDLTNTARYYDKKQVMDKEGFRYVKMAMEGHGLAPSKEERTAFLTAVDDFLAEYEKEVDASPVVAIHCTHGFNRTGFLICYYLMKRRGMNPYEALIEFKKQRAPGIYRDVYAKDLYSIWAKEMDGDAEKVPEAPKVVTPPWLIVVNPENQSQQGREGRKRGYDDVSRKLYDTTRNWREREQSQHAGRGWENGTGNPKRRYGHHEHFASSNYYPSSKRGRPAQWGPPYNPAMGMNFGYGYPQWPYWSNPWGAWNNTASCWTGYAYQPNGWNMGQPFAYGGTGVGNTYPPVPIPNHYNHIPNNYNQQPPGNFYNNNDIGTNWNRYGPARPGEQSDTRIDNENRHRQSPTTLCRAEAEDQSRQWRASPESTTIQS